MLLINVEEEKSFLVDYIEWEIKNNTEYLMDIMVKTNTGYSLWVNESVAQEK